MGSAVLREQFHLVLRRALKLFGVLDEDDAIAPEWRFGQDRVDQRGLSRSGATRHKNVFPVIDTTANDVGTDRRQDSLGNIIVKCEDNRRPLANREHRPFSQWW
jgi:hypothetical protein